MEERAEPRFKTDSATVVEVVRDQAYIFNGRIKNVSALGFQLELAQPLMVGETIRLTVEGYHSFAQVRRCSPSDSLFEIGVERIDQWDGMAFDRTIGAPPVADVPEPLGRPVLRNPLGNLRSVALRELFSGSRQKEAGKSTEAGPLKEAGQPKEAVQPKKRVLKYQGALIAAACIALAGWAGGVVVSRSHGHKPSEKVVSSETSSPATEPIQSNTPPLATAPATTAPSLTESKPSQSTSTPVNSTPASLSSPTTAPARTTPLSVAPVNTPAVSASPTSPSSATSTGIAPAASKVSAGASSTVIAPRVAGAANRISLKATDVSWVTACVDGKNLFSKLFKKGDAEEVPFSRFAVVRSGNAGALELAIGREAIGTLGTWGAIRTIKVTPAGHEFVAPALASNCSGE